ncbi:alkaline protease, partial [Myriangium duriaei CBS 260.36]
VSHRYKIANFQAYAGHFHSLIIQQLQNHSDVEAIEPDQTSKVMTVTKQDPSPYGLSLISHRTLHEHGYIYDSSAGNGTFAYIIDSGIDIQHEEFVPRASYGFSKSKRRSSRYRDRVGHGTHVAGIVGSNRYGVAKKCNLIAVKVMSCIFSFTYTNMLAGLEWAVNDILEHEGRKYKAVINISLGGAKSDAVNKAIDESYKSGVTIVVAAGNENKDVSNSSPASAEGAITVASTDDKRERSMFSNFGRGVNLFAPGEDIPSTWIGGREHDRNRTLSGTSMAAPYVTGLALYLQGLGRFDAKTLRELLIRLATKDVVAYAEGSPNMFAYNGGG